MQKSTEISERISEILDILDSNPNSFAKVLGYQRAQTIYDIVNGKSAPSYDFFRRFQLSEYSEIINMGWLLTGQGEILINQNDDNKNAKVNAKVSAKVSAKVLNENSDINTEKVLSKVAQVQVCLPGLLDNEESLSVPFYDLPVSAGSLGILEGDSFNTVPPSGHIQIPAFRGCEAVFPIVGISMEPLVFSGDWIGIKSIENLSRSWDFVQTDVIYLIITREDRMIKFIEKASDDEYIICRSPNASPFRVHKGDILSIHRVKAIARGL